MRWELTFTMIQLLSVSLLFFFFQAEDGIRDKLVTGVQTCALPICSSLQCFSLSRGNLVALETSLPLKTGTQFFVRQSSITKRALDVALEHGRFNATGGQLFISMFSDGVAFRQFLARFFAHSHPANAPGIECYVDRIRQCCIGNVLFLQKLFHQ